MKPKYLLDIEVYPTTFMVGLKDYYTGELESIEVSPWLDQRERLFEWLDFDGFLITFNGVNYDETVLQYIKKNQDGLIWSTPEEFCYDIWGFSDSVIRDDFEKIKEYKWNRSWTSVDLYLYWAKMLRLSKKISLKSLGIQLGWPKVQELPYPPGMTLNQQQWEEVKDYNLSNDLGILELLTKQFTGKGYVSIGNLGTIQLRKHIVDQYKINAWSMDSPKIASEILLKEYCKITGQDKKEVRKWRFNKPIIYFRELFKDVDFDFQTLPFQKVYEEWMNSTDTFKKEFIVGTTHPIKISVGVGGIHSINNNEIYESDEDYVIVTDDIGAMYPTNIENWKAFRFPEVLGTYSGFKQKRIVETKPGLKKHKKGSKEWNEFFQQDLFYKLILNGVSGLLDMEQGWLYYPEGIMKVRCGGQLILLWLIEQCIINGIEVISTNTDGLEVRVKRTELDLYLSLVKKAEQKFNITFEREFYKKIIYSNVNCYLAILENGSLKKKGSLFLTHPELGNSVDFLVVPKCLELYFVQGLKPEQVLSDPKKYGLHIYDFCASFKVNKDYTVLWNNQKQQRLNRFYVSKNAPYLYKQKNTKSKPDNMLKGWGVQIYNLHEEKEFEDYKIDYTYYLSEINKVISELHRHNQLKLF